jgi:hypothetical protein
MGDTICFQDKELGWMKTLRMCAALALVGCGEDGPSEAPTSEVVQVAAISLPLDATPSPDGETVYFVTPSALYRAAEGAPVKLADIPRASSVVARDDMLFVGTAQGVLAVPVAGGDPTQVPGTEGFDVRMLDLTDRLVLAGAAPGDVEGVFVVPFSGGTPEAVVTGLDNEPSGVLALDDGAYVVAMADGRVMRAQGEVAEIIFEYEDLGLPATGLALAPDGRLMISSVSASGTAQVLLLDETGATTVFDQGIGANRSAAGLHRAEGGGTWAWADSSEGGGVYRIRLRL